VFGAYSCFYKHITPPGFGIVLQKLLSQSYKILVAFV
jgi:hypothetical protein